MPPPSSPSRPRGERERVRSGPGVVALGIGIVLALIGLGAIAYDVITGMRGTTPVITAPADAGR